MHVSITTSHVKGNNIAMYIDEQQNQLKGEYKPILVAALNEHTQKKGGKNKTMYSLLVAALNEHTQKKKKKGGKKEKEKKKNKPI